MKNHWLFMLLVIATPGWAVEPYAATPAEAAMCQVRVYSRLGPRDRNTMHMHHYCDGLRFLDRAYAAMRNKSDMRYKAERSVANFGYVLKNTEESYAMRGEVHLNKGRALKLLGRKAEAATEFNKALRYEIGSADAYQELVDHFKETGNKTKALEMATEGLRRNPDSKALKRRYTELDGTLPYPAAIEAAQAPHPSTATDEKAAAPVTAHPVDATSGAPIPAVPAAPAAAETIAPPKVGSPSNPYCRFCPD